MLDRTTGLVRWHGFPLGAPVEEVEPVSDASHAIVLLDYMSGSLGPFENLVCVDCDGSLVWQAELPSTSSTEAYVSFELAYGRLTANSWSGYSVELDPRTGKLITSTFTK